MLAPTLREEDIVVMDNMRIHYFSNLILLCSILPVADDL